MREATHWGDGLVSDIVFGGSVVLDNLRKMIEISERFLENYSENS